MAKKKRQPQETARPAPRRHGPQIDEERRNQVLLIGGAIAVVILALIIALFGYYDTRIAPKGEAVTEVNGEEIDLRYFERRARYDVLNGDTSFLTDLTRAADNLVSRVVAEEVVRQAAPAEGITVTKEEIDQEILRREGVALDEDPEVIANVFRRKIQDTGLATDDYRDLVAVDILQTRLRDKFTAEAPATDEQVRYRLILTNTEAEAQAAIDRLNAGEDFAIVATELSGDTASAENGGERPWGTHGSLDPTLEETLYSLAVGQRSEVFQIASGFAIVELLERQADRPLEEAQLVAISAGRLLQWQQEKRDEARVLTFLDEDQTNDILQAYADAQQELL